MLLAEWWFISNREWKECSISNTASEDKAQFVSADKTGSDVQGKDLLFQICFSVCFPASSPPHQPSAAVCLIHLNSHQSTFACKPLWVCGLLRCFSALFCNFLHVCVCFICVCIFSLYLFLCLPQAFSSLCFKQKLFWQHPSSLSASTFLVSYPPFFAASLHVFPRLSLSLCFSFSLPLKAIKEEIQDGKQLK